MAERYEGTRGDATSGGFPGFGKRGMNRRDFLKLAGTGLAGASLLGVAGCGGGGEQGGGGPVEVTFATTPDPTGTFQKLIDQFNGENEGRIAVNYQQAPPDSSQFFDQLRTEFQAGSARINVFEGDVTWPAQFAAPGYVADLSDRFTQEERQKFLEGPVQSNIYQDAPFGVPWRTDAGFLYYRKDLLDEAGLEPPRTWDELKQTARTVQESAGTEFGYVFQGADYEGGVVNGLEYIWNAGGDVLDPSDPNKVVIDNPGAVEGLSVERSMVEDGLAPAAVSTFKEDESTAAFLNGDAVFLRNWPYVYAQAADPETSKVKQEQVGIAPLPSASGGESASGLGGWNLMINAASDQAVQDASYELIKFMTAPEQQRTLAIEGSYLPILQELYDDQEVVDAVPVMALGKEAIQNTKPRPVSPYYSDMSLRMAEQFNASLDGETSPQQAVSTLQEALTEIVEQGQAL